jgi:hypothetical protein
MAKGDNSTTRGTVTASARITRFNNLKTEEDLQADIQKMQSEAKTTAASAKDAETKATLNNILCGFKMIVDNIANIRGMKFNQVADFWNNSYTLLENTQNIINPKQ